MGDGPPLTRARKSSASDFLEHPGRKYPRLGLVLVAVVLFCLITWLPHLAEKDRGPVAFVWPENQTRSARQLVRPEAVTTLISPSAICPSAEGTAPPYLLVVVCSAVANTEAREAIRQSWAKDQNSLPGVKVVFLVGQLVNSSHQVGRPGEDTDDWVSTSVCQHSIVQNAQSIFYESAKLFQMIQCPF